MCSPYLSARSTDSPVGRRISTSRGSTSLRLGVPAYLSLHGGTGVSRADLAAAIRHGIVKVSYFHGMAEAALERLRAAVVEAHHGMLTTLLDESIRPAFRDRALEFLSLVGDPVSTGLT